MASRAMSAILWMILSLTLLASAQPSEDARHDVYADPATAWFGAAVVDHVDLRQVDVGDAGSSTLVTWRTYAQAPHPGDRLLYRMNFAGDWVAWGEASVQVQDGRIVRTELILDEGSGFVRRPFYARLVGEDTIEAYLPDDALRGPLEGLYFSSELHPRPAGQSLGTGYNPGVGDRVPDQGYLPAYAPASS